MHALQMEVSRLGWLPHPAHCTEVDPNVKMREIREKVVKRDNFTCYYCGFKSQRWQEVHHLDHNHKNVTLKNLVTVCPLCHQAFHLPVADSTGGGAIVWLPEMSQITLNRLCITLFVALRYDNHEMSGAARTIFGHLESRKEFLDENITQGASDPGIFAQALLDMPKEEYASRDSFLSSFRLLPYASRFKVQTEYWDSFFFKDKKIDDWEKMMPEGVDPIKIFKEFQTE